MKRYSIEAFKTPQPTDPIIEEQLAALDKANIKHLADIFPAGIIPVYLSPLDPEKQVLETATWSQYSDVGPYSNTDDGYCRPSEGNPAAWLFPRRNPENGDIELESCSKLITPDILELIRLTGITPALLDIAKG
jgi:hypothetical protein